MKAVLALAMVAAAVEGATVNLATVTEFVGTCAAANFATASLLYAEEGVCTLGGVALSGANAGKQVSYVVNCTTSTVQATYVAPAGKASCSATPTYTYTSGCDLDGNVPLGVPSNASVSCAAYDTANVVTVTAFSDKDCTAPVAPLIMPVSKCLPNLINKFKPNPPEGDYLKLTLAGGNLTNTQYQDSACATSVGSATYAPGQCAMLGQITVAGSSGAVNMTIYTSFQVGVPFSTSAPTSAGAVAKASMAAAALVAAVAALVF
jgi:hypothetical protein